MPEELRQGLIARMKANPINYWLGKKRVNFKLSETGRANIVKGLQNRTVSEKVILRMSILNKGKKGKEHPKWTENKKRPFYGAIRTLHQYKDWRSNIFRKDDYTCQMCFKRGTYLEADHFPRRFIEIVKDNNISTIDEAIVCKKLWEAEGRTLCKRCHLTTYQIKKR